MDKQNINATLRDNYFLIKQTERRYKRKDIDALVKIKRAVREINRPTLRKEPIFVIDNGFCEKHIYTGYKLSIINQIRLIQSADIRHNRIDMSHEIKVFEVGDKIIVYHFMKGKILNDI